MKKAVVITVQALFLTLIVLFGSSEAAIIYSESFVSEQTYCPGSSQYDHWALFRQQLDTNTNNFTSVTIKGSQDPVGVSCSDQTTVNQIATALRNATTGTWSCNGRTWAVWIGCGGGNCGGNANAVELNATGSNCACDDPGYIVRPGIGNPNWGGVNTATCDAPTQTMAVVFATTATATAVPTINEWGMIIFVILLGIGSIYYLRRRAAA
jgi:hypothetical protein